MMFSNEEAPFSILSHRLSFMQCILPHSMQFSGVKGSITRQDDHFAHECRRAVLMTRIVKELVSIISGYTHSLKEILWSKLNVNQPMQCARCLQHYFIGQVRHSLSVSGQLSGHFPFAMSILLSLLWCLTDCDALASWQPRKTRVWESGANAAASRASFEVCHERHTHWNEDEEYLNEPSNRFLHFTHPAHHTNPTQ